MGRTRAAIAVVSALAAVAATFFVNATPAAAQTSTATTATATADAYCQTTFSVLSQWATGYLAELRIRNISSVTVRWQALTLQLTDPRVIIQAWNVTSTQIGSVVAIYPSPPSSGVLAPGESRTIAFISSSSPLVALPTAVATCSPV